MQVVLNLTLAQHIELAALRLTFAAPLHDMLQEWRVGSDAVAIHDHGEAAVESAHRAQRDDMLQIAATGGHQGHTALLKVCRDVASLMQLARNRRPEEHIVLAFDED